MVCYELAVAARGADDPAPTHLWRPDLFEAHRGDGACAGGIKSAVPRAQRRTEVVEPVPDLEQGELSGPS
jgi:hypothetical protein